MKSFRIFIFLAASLILLALLAAFYPQPGYSIAGHRLRYPSLSSILKPQKQMDIDAYLARQDSLNNLLRLQQDSLNAFRAYLDTSDIRFWFPNHDDSFFDTLFSQFNSIPQSGRTIRILHYGDSQIEMDRITNRLRSYMQSHFGGGGPGLVPFATLIPSLSVSTYGTGNLVRQSPFGDSLVVRAAGNYGPMVQDFHVDGSATSSIKAGTHRSCDSRLLSFNRAKFIFCNRPGPLSVTISSRRGTHQQFECPDEGVHAVEYRFDSLTDNIHIAVSGHADLYGTLVDRGPGVAVDNIPMRGCSGHQFTQINADQLAQAYALMDVGLIIMQFGGNSVPYLRSAKSISNYCKEMGNQIDRLHRCCPQALILFIGPSDMCSRPDSVSSLRTYSWLPQVVDSLCATATAHGAAYWSIYHAMGGANSMPAWVNNGLGSPDYVHFSQKGADIMGDRLANAFDNMYRLYLLRKESQQ